MFKKLLYLQFTITSVLVAVLGMAGFAILLIDFQAPGTFKAFYVFRGGMPLNFLLLLLFGFQHSIMARRSFKNAMKRFFPIELERSVYVMASGFVLMVMAALWSPSHPPLYDLRGEWSGYLLSGLAFLGIPILFIAGQAFDVWDLFGVRSVLRILQNQKPELEPLKTPKIYRMVRHPLYLGMLFIFWFTPAMTHDHLFFAEVMTAYILLGIQFEEADLVRNYGESYRKYQREVPMLLPFWPKKKKG